MKRRPVTTALILMSLALLAASLAGCQMTPAGRALEARKAYTATLDSLATLRQGGLIDDATARSIETDRVAVAEALDALDLAAAGAKANPQTFKEAVAEFNAALDRLLVWQAKTQGKH